MPKRPPTYKPAWLKPTPKKVDPFYQSAAWREFRARELKRRGYRCELAPGCEKRATHLDHTIPINQGGAKLDPSNCKAGCHSCHSRKTATEDGGFGNRKRVGREVLAQTPAQSQPASNWVGIA